MTIKTICKTGQQISHIPIALKNIFKDGDNYHKVNLSVGIWLMTQGHKSYYRGELINIGI